MFSQDSENRELKELQSINKLIYLKLNLRLENMERKSEVKVTGFTSQYSGGYGD